MKEGGGGDIEALVDTPTHTAPTHPSLEQQGLLRRSVLVPSIPLSVLHSHTHPQPPSPPPLFHILPSCGNYNMQKQQAST